VTTEEKKKTALPFSPELNKKDSFKIYGIKQILASPLVLPSLETSGSVFALCFLLLAILQ